MKIEFDQHKRDKTLQERGLDFCDAVRVFAGRHLRFEDNRRNYRVTRTVTFGLLDGKYELIAWTERIWRSERVRRIISMRRANGREIERYLAEMERRETRA